MNTPMRRLVTTVAIALAGAAGLAACQQPDDDMVDRAGGVMPFDLTTTTHEFTKTDTGGVQEVVAADPDDTENITLIRTHLQHEVDAFRDGDFGDPASIHGENMAGLAELEARSAELEIVFEEIEAGGRITYSATDPELVDAIHAWFDHQNADHSLPGMGG